MSTSMAPHVFAIVPVEAFQDRRLSLEQLRVLGVLLTFRSKNTNTCWPSREAIAERCGYPVTRISEATSALCRLGWLEKIGSGGRGKSSQYRITVPESVTVSTPKTVTEQETVTEQVTVTESVTKRLPNGGPPIRTDQEQTSISPSFHSGESAHAIRRPDVNPTENANLRSDGPQTRATGRARESQRATRMTEGFELPADWRQWAVQERPGMEVERTFATFRDHWLANGKTMVDWRATWRNWVRREAQFARRDERNRIDWHDSNW